MPNRLATSTSPYLRQHQDNPVDWYEWSPEAFARARAEHKPILLSVGYSACHWCHVMAHESFEDPAIAAVMNERFVNVKVDREQRPDVDAIYQKVVQLLGQGGGWPLTVWLTPEQEPMYGGTYFPPQPRHGRPSFSQVLDAIDDLWRNQPTKIAAQVTSFREGLASLARMVDDERVRVSSSVDPGEPTAVREAVAGLLRRCDATWGGFGRAPKFPNPTALELLLAQSRRQGDPQADEAGTALRLALDRMYEGGIYDHLRGGFARYSVDREWLVPHFEKMLYDNAQLLPLYAEAAVRWPEAEHLRVVVRETIDYLVADMRADDGRFYAATDADSEGEEGRYFTWTPAELDEVLDADDRELVAEVYDVTVSGNFEHGRSILHLVRPLALVARERGLADAAELRVRLAGPRARLLAARGQRVPPLRDEKLLTSSNALLASGLVRTAAAAAAWGDVGLSVRVGELARRLVDTLHARHVEPGGNVLRTAFADKVEIRGVLDDVALLARACLDLHELDLEPLWHERAAALAAHAILHYVREDRDGFYFTAADAEVLIERSESVHDGPTPSGLAVIVDVLARLDAADAAPEGTRALIERVLDRFRGAPGQPFAYASLVGAAMVAGPEARFVKLFAPAPADALAWAAEIRSAALARPWPVHLTYVRAPKLSAVVCRAQTCTARLGELPAVLAHL